MEVSESGLTSHYALDLVVVARASGLGNATTRHQNTREKIARFWDRQERVVIATQKGVLVRLISFFNCVISFNFMQYK